MATAESSGATLTVKQAARATGLSPKALRRRIERGSLGSTLVDGLRRIPMSDLLRAGLLVPYESSGGVDERAVARAGRVGRGRTAVTDAGDLRALRERITTLEDELASERTTQRGLASELAAERERGDALERRLERLEAGQGASG